MRLFETCLTLAGLLALSGAAAAHAQARPDRPTTPPRSTPSDSRLAPSLTALGAPDAWKDPAQPAPAIHLQWKGSDSAWDLSAASRFVEEAEANARDFQSQGLFEAEGAVVRRIGDFRVGAVGYSARSVGDRTRVGPRLGPMKWQGSAAGPIVGYDTRIAGKPATLALRWYREIDAPGENGDTVAASFALRF